MSFVLYITATEQQLWRRDGDVWQRWAGEPGGSVWVVTDLPEESFSDIRMPRLFGRDRSSFIARQLATAYPDTLYRGYLTPPQDGGAVGKLIPTRQILYGISAAERIDAALAAINAPVAGVWPMSMLLATLSRHKHFPANLLVALPGPETLRIVYLHRGSPVLARLTSTPNEPAAQVDEMVRTLRYLDNAQIVRRDRAPQPVLYLGNHDRLAGAMTAANLSLLELPTQYVVGGDARFALFDLVLKSPRGQVAPLDRRVDYVSGRVSKYAIVAAALVLIVAVAAAGVNLFSIFGMRNRQQDIDVSTQQTRTEIAALDQKIGSFGVSPDLVRRAIALNEKEIASIPSMGEHFQLIAEALSVDPGLRLDEMKWRLLQPNVLPCSAVIDASAPAPEAAAPDRAVEERKVEIAFTVTIPASYGPRDRAAVMRNLSARLTEIKNIKIWKDAIKDSVDGSLQGGSEITETGKIAWCLTLPGAAPTAVSSPAISSAVPVKP